MMRALQFSRDYVQKLMLNGLVGAALIYGYYVFLLQPLAKQKAAMSNRIADLETKTQQGEKDIRGLAALEANSGETRSRYSRLQSIWPDGPPVAWFPPRLKEFFANAGIDQCSVRLSENILSKRTGLPELVQSQWSVELPKSDFRILGAALADFENKEPLLAINEIHITTLRDDPGFQHVLMGIRMIAHNVR